MIAGERETIVNVNDADDVVRIWTCRRADITALKKKVAVAREGIHPDGTAWAEFQIPRSRYSVSRGIKTTRTLTPEQRLAAAERFREARNRRKETE